MNIDANNIGWKFDDSTAWKLIHNDEIVIFYEYTDKPVSTQEQLFVCASKEECDQYIVDRKLIYQADNDINNNDDINS